MDIGTPVANISRSTFGGARRGKTGLIAAALAIGGMTHAVGKSKAAQKAAYFVAQNPSIVEKTYDHLTKTNEEQMDQRTIPPDQRLSVPPRVVRGTINKSPPGNMAGYNNTPSSYIQPSGTGYDSPFAARSNGSPFRSFPNPRYNVQSPDEKFNLNRLVRPENDNLADRKLETYY